MKEARLSEETVNAENLRTLEKLYVSKENLKWGPTSIEVPPHTLQMGNYK